MTEIEIFQLFGLLFFAIGLGMIANPKFFKTALDEIDQSPLALYIGGLASLAIGYFIVAFHDVWRADWSLIITLLGWLAVIKGVMILVFPISTGKFYKKMAKNKNCLNVAAWVVTVLGVISLLFGYFL
jgi:uncharacterized protein YjeT (DUF2065 family)